MKLIVRLFLLLGLSVSSMAQPRLYRQYLYDDQWRMGSPSGYYGAANGSGMKIIQNYDVKPFAGNKCVRIKTNGKEAWSGFFVLSAGKWKNELKGETSALSNLSGAETLVVNIRAEKPTKVTLGLGENSESHTGLTGVEVGKEWKTINIPVAQLDLSSLNGLFSITLTGADTVYLDEIYFESKKPFVNSAVATASAKKLTPVKVTIQKRGEDSFVLMREGKPYYVKGAGGNNYLDRVQKYGGNSIRTWSHDNARAILDSAQKYGLTVMMGLWLQHERHGFDYDDKEAVYYQLQGFKEVVMDLKDHPALLCWGIGNEVDLFYKNTNVWYAVEDIAKMVHQLDPNHPTTTVTAGLDAEEIRLINERCPDIDFMSINTYGDLENVVPAGIRKAGWKGGYMITEWGPTGHWEIANTDFKIPVEQTSAEKAKVYRERYLRIASDSSKCMGSYVFLWGNKQETTPTWYSMFLSDGSESEILDVMEMNWANRWPKNRAPSLSSAKINGKNALDNIYLQAGNTASAEVIVKDPENKPMQYVWVFMPESTDKKSGGDFEKTPEAITGLITENQGSKISFKAPSQPGPYRLFFYAYDDEHNVAYANIPFYVEQVKP
ncbi:MAG TPA: glycoside hydrolase family 2 TIM barrel-domain containing protein [Cytophagaceae bacterium]|jgi:hypothetical protein|nr:glycoside hydrolase family 2 TIM barrel-domain containing protein [Cytophagaceae bacterium]